MNDINKFLGAQFVDKIFNYIDLKVHKLSHSHKNN